MVAVYERKAAVKTILFKFSHLKVYIPNFDKLSAFGFFDITIKNTLKNLIVSANVVKLSAIIFCSFVYF